MALMRMRMDADGQKHATFRAADAADAACGCRGSAHVPQCGAIATTTGSRCRLPASGPRSALCALHVARLQRWGRCICVDPSGARCPWPVGPTLVICHGRHDFVVAMQVAQMDVEKREALARAPWECKEDLC
jgi:hypothetical protein